MELNAEQIKKALGDCVLGDCYPCAYREIVGCRDKMCGDALALINSQEHRIKELTEEYESMANSVNEASDLIRKLKADKKELSEENERYKRYYLNHEYDKMEADVRADTVRKMQERLKALLKTDYINGTREQAISVIDQIAKEMVEGKT